MKNSLLILLSFLFPAVATHAGNMFGPAPFRNGSSLVSGVDGTYQATARAENLTGIFRFSYSGGSQTTDVNNNKWIFFVNGRVTRGSVFAAIDDSSISGSLDKEASMAAFTSYSYGYGNGTATNSLYSSSSVNLLYIQISDVSDSSSGTFSGKLNLKSPNGDFNGSGIIMPTPEKIGSVLAITDGYSGNFTYNPSGNYTSTDTYGYGIQVTNVAFTNQSSLIPQVNFKFRGVRTSTASSALPQNN